MRIFRVLLLLTVLAVVLTCLGCGGGKKNTPETDVWKEPWEVRVESPLDTMTVVSTDDAVMTETATPEPGGGLTEETPISTETSPVDVPSPEVFTPGWRVQILAASSMVSAEDLAREARGRFTEAVYVEYEPPLYKVRVGDFLTKAAAKQMVTRAQAEGFDAWVVETLVVRPDQ